MSHFCKFLIIAMMIIEHCSSLAYGDDEVWAQTALSLASAARERDNAKYQAAIYSNPCRSDWDETEKEALRTGKAVVIWVGMKCCENKELRLTLPDALHIHLPSMNDNPSPRVVLADPSRSPNALLIVEKDQINRATGEQFKTAYKRSQQMNGNNRPNPWRVQ